MSENQEMTELAEDWIKLQYTNSTSEAYEALIESSQKLWRLGRSDPSGCLEVVLEILRVDSSDFILANLGAGLIEDILARHGREVMDEVERIAKVNSDFKKALSMVWRQDMPEGVWARLQACCKT